MNRKNIGVENELSNRVIRKVNEECDLKDDDTFKADNYILLIVSKVGWLEILFQERQIF